MTIDYWIAIANRHLDAVVHLQAQLAELTCRHNELQARPSLSEFAARRQEAEGTITELREQIANRDLRLADLGLEWEAQSERIMRLEQELANRSDPGDDPTPVEQPITPKTVARPQPKVWEPIGCKWCGKVFTPNYQNRVYCSFKCAPPGKRVK